jgi:hypothetical protein
VTASLVRQLQAVRRLATNASRAAILTPPTAESVLHIAQLVHDITNRIRFAISGPMFER